MGCLQAVLSGEQACCDASLVEGACCRSVSRQLLKPRGVLLLVALRGRGGCACVLLYVAVGRLTGLPFSWCHCAQLPSQVCALCLRLAMLLQLINRSQSRRSEDGSRVVLDQRLSFSFSFCVCEVHTPAVRFFFELGVRLVSSFMSCWHALLVVEVGVLWAVAYGASPWF